MLAGDVSALYLAMDWTHMLVQLLTGDPDRARLAEHLESTCRLLCYPGCSSNNGCLILCIGACVFALRQLGCSADIISWVQDHAQVISVITRISRMLPCKLRRRPPQSFPYCCLLLPIPLLGPLACYLYPRGKFFSVLHVPQGQVPNAKSVYAAADTFITMANQH